MKLQNDKYRKTRGGTSRLLDIQCEKCNHHLFYYQKDGPGIIKRLYLDRIYPSAPRTKQLLCPNCGELLGLKTLYKKEDKPAFKIFAGTITKKIISAMEVR